MDKIYIGKIVSTHGIKGEIRIKSSFDYKEKAFKVGTNIIVDDNKYKITSYRRHKDFEMITLDGYTNINDVLFLMKKNVYKEKEELNLDKYELLYEDLLYYKIIDQNNNIGRVRDLFEAGAKYKILRVLFENDDTYLIPYTEPFIKEINPDKKEIIVELIEGMKA